MDVAVIGDEDTVLGFQLIGCRNCTVFDEKTIKETLDRYKDAKIMVITEKVGEHLKQIKNICTGVVVEIPDKSGSTGRAKAEIARIFESAISVKLKEGS